jgi:hypothetical protein
MATGINATKARARAQLTDFETRANMRLSSAIKLMNRWKKAACEQTFLLAQVLFATNAKFQTL